MDELRLAPAHLPLAISLGDWEFSVEIVDEAGDPVNASGVWDAMLLPEPTSQDGQLAVFSVDTTDAAAGVIRVSITRSQIEPLFRPNASHVAARWVLTWDGAPFLAGPARIER